MGDRLVLWSGGGRFVASKDVAAAAIAQRIKVVWDDGSINYLSATNASDYQFKFSGGWYVKSSTLRSYISCSAQSQNETYWIRASSAPFAGYGGGYPAPFPPTWEPTNEPPSDVDTVLSANWSYSIRRSFSSCGQTLYDIYLSRNGLVYTSDWLGYQTRNFYQFGYLNAYKITTSLNSGGVRKKASSIPLISYVPVISITYTDGTKTDIPVTYTPTWVQKYPANSCPPNTCFECVHDGEKCCFAKDTDGLIKVIDRFHITS